MTEYLHTVYRQTLPGRTKPYELLAIVANVAVAAEETEPRDYTLDFSLRRDATFHFKPTIIAKSEGPTITVTVRGELELPLRPGENPDEIVVGPSVGPLKYVTYDVAGFSSQPTSDGTIAVREFSYYPGASDVPAETSCSPM